MCGTSATIGRSTTSSTGGPSSPGVSAAEWSRACARPRSSAPSANARTVSTLTISICAPCPILVRLCLATRIRHSHSSAKRSRSSRIIPLPTPLPSVEAFRLGAVILGHAGRGEQAVEYAQLRLSPLDPSIVHSYNALGIAHCPAGNWEGVASACGKAIQANPRFSLPLVLQAAALSFLGRWDEARAAARRVPELEPGFTVSSFVRSHTGRAEIWEPIGDALRRLGLPE